MRTPPIDAGATRKPASVVLLTPVLCALAHAASWWVWKCTSSVTPDYLWRWSVAYVGTALVITSILNRLLVGWLGTQLLIGAVWAAGTWKEQLLQQPLLAHDVVFFLRNTRHNIELLKAYPDHALLAGVGLGLTAATVTWCMRKETGWAPIARGRRHTVRVLSPVLCCFIVFHAWSFTFGENARERGQNILRREVDSFIHEVWFMQQLRFNALPRFLESFWEFEIVEPRDVEQAKRFQALTLSRPRAPVVPVAPKPDILVVLRESHVDLRQLWVKPPSAGPTKRTPIRWTGEMRVHTFGGGTWLTEFSFLTGFSWGDFGQAGSYAPFTLAPRMREGLPVQLRRLGYRTVAFYPVAGTFLNSRVAYDEYGFEAFYSSEDLRLPQTWRNLGDREIYAAALQRLHDTSDGRPTFAFILTMLNHGPHTRRWPAPVENLPGTWPEQVSRSVSDYLNRQQQTQRDFAWLRQQWFARQTPRVLVSFGDHWPSLEGSVVWLANRLPPMEQARRRLFRTPLEFEANFPLPAKAPAGEYDVVFVGSTVLEIAGLEGGTLFEGNRMLRDHCGARYIEADDQPLVRGYLTWARLVQGAWR